jgi:hypothetical protein
MRKFIVTTTIQKPTEATIRFSNMEGWTLIVVGDTKTPHDEYKKINCIYLHPDEQEKKYPDLSNAIGWKSIQRRNLGFVEAYHLGADIVATVDDDNIPYDGWGTNLLVGKEVDVDYYDASSVGVFDALSVTNHPDIWHRGFPIQRLSHKNDVVYLGKKRMRVDVQADLWDGDPDIDAMCRLTKKPIVKFNVSAPYAANTIAPFNSQNTFLTRDMLKHYMMLPHVGRMDDIWGAYILQKKIDCGVVFCPASVYQERNLQDLVTNLEKEVIGYRNTDSFIRGEYALPSEVQYAYDTYCACFNS